MYCESDKNWVNKNKIIKKYVSKFIKVYRPFEDDELPRTSSRNYRPDEIKGEPFIYEILEPGDLLYVPRGWIHQGEVLVSNLWSKNVQVNF